MILTGKILRIEGGEIVIEFPDFPEQQKAALLDDGRIAYTVNGAARVLDISRTKLWRLMALKKIRKNDDGLISRKELERYANNLK